ncbi:MAG: F0F1 ATP synthase subunit alpha, partial [Lentisphaerae bacterium]|nr:F0F1 ATP synthase subunit alpha [Lentisphaerota bacterium]
MADEKKIRPEEVTEVLKRQLERYRTGTQITEVGTVLQVGDGIARIHGLPNAMANELLEFPKGIFGVAMNLERDHIGCAILGDDKAIKEGDTVKSTGRIMEVPVGVGLIGRIVNALGQPIDGKGVIPTKKHRPIERRAPSVIERQPVREPLQTGLKAIDSMVPIGRGQRELIIGDRQTGKTAIAIDAMINQKEEGVTCIYVAIGQRSSTVAQIYDRLQKAGAMDYSIIVSACASDPAPL